MRGFIWIHLNHGAQILGFVWMLVGIAIEGLMRWSKQNTPVSLSK